jgi:hypothetical protein
MAEIIIARGSDKRLEITWRQAGTTTAMPLSGHTVEVYDVVGLPADRITATIVDATAGRVDVQIEGTTLIRTGDKSFRVRVTPTGGDSTGSLAIPFRVV